MAFSRVENWPKVRTVTCCKCAASFETKDASTHTAIVDKQDGWDEGVDVGGRIVVYCPQHTRPRVERSVGMIFVNPTKELSLEWVRKADDHYVLGRESDGAAAVVTSQVYEGVLDWRAEIVGVEIPLVVSDQPPFRSRPNGGTVTYIVYFTSLEYTQRLAQAALGVYLATRRDWEKESIEVQNRYLRERVDELSKLLAKDVFGRLFGARR